jgi:hypothetical protein
VVVKVRKVIVVGGGLVVLPVVAFV